MTNNETITGSIIAVRDCGSLVLVFLDTDDERTIPIPMERRAFRWLLDGEDCQTDELVGRRIRFDGKHILFLERECPK
jgi:hypothetical protein